MNSATIVQKLWNYCNVLRDDGMSYGDYVEQNGDKDDRDACRAWHGCSVEAVSSPLDWPRAAAV